MPTKHVIYLTGSPASGKSTLLEGLCRAIPDVIPFSFGSVLTEFVNKRDGTNYSQDQIRTHSANLISPEDVESVDRRLVELVRLNRESRTVIIDSHPVTKESFGFRVTPFSVERLKELDPTLIIALYCPSDVTIHRISLDSGGRPLVTADEADAHNYLQGSVAVSYGIHLGRPVYFFDSSCSREELLSRVVTRILR